MLELARNNAESAWQSARFADDTDSYSEADRECMI